MLQKIKNWRKPKKKVYNMDELHPKLKAELKKQEAIEANRQAISYMGLSLEQKLKLEQLKNNPTNATNYEFRNYRNPNDRKRFNGIERTQYAPGVNHAQFSIANYSEPFVHGKVIIREYDVNGNGRVLASDDVYMYAPKFEGTRTSDNRRQPLGPRFKPDGTLGKNPYYYMDPSSQEIYIANIPKRELISGRCFDFDPRNKNNFEATSKSLFQEDHRSLDKIVEIQYDYTPEGNIKTVDLNNTSELTSFQGYIQRMQNLLVAGQKMDSYINIVKREMNRAQTIDLQIQAQAASTQASVDVAQQAAASAQTQAQTQQQSVADQNARDWENMVRYGIQPTVAAQVAASHHGPGARVVGARPMHGGPRRGPGPGRGR